nr:hypothetical protein [Tanacetum cinerariifolium]
LEIGFPISSSYEVEETNKKGIDNSNSKKVSDELDIGMQIGCENGTPRTEALGATKIRNVGSCSPLDISSEAAKADIIQSNSNGVQRSNDSDDMGSTTNNAFTTKLDDKPLPNNSTVVVHKTYTTLESLVPSTTEGGDKVKTSGQQVQVHHHHHDYHHHHHHDDGSLRNIESNILTGSSSVQVVEGGKIESDNGVAKNDNGVPKKDNGVVIKCNDGDGSGSGSGQGSGVDQERLSQRVAALNKFHHKRKERRFEKKRMKNDYSMIAPLGQLKSELKSFLLATNQNTTAFKEVAIIYHPRPGEYAFGFITSSVVLHVL